MGVCSNRTEGNRTSAIAVCVCFLLVTLGKTGATNFSSVQWNTAIKLSAYTGYKSVSLLGYRIPEQTDVVTFSIEARTSGEACTFQEVHVYLQQGGYPLVNLYNETFPNNFYTNRTDAYHVIVKKNDGMMSVSISVPRPGQWYLGAFLPKQTSDKIEQKGLDKSCMFGMVVAMNARGIHDVQDISPDRMYNIHLKQAHSFHRKTYRFMLPKTTASYSFIIDQCTTKHLKKSSAQGKLSNSSSSSSTLPTTSTTQSSSNLCPVIVRIGSEVLPWSHTAVNVNCSGSVCEKEIMSPVVDKWTYIDIKIDSLHNISEIMFRLRFELKSCGTLRINIPQAAYDEPQGNTTLNDSPMVPSTLPQDMCVMMDPLGRFAWNRQAINVTFLLATKGVPGFPPLPVSLSELHVYDSTVIVSSITIEDNVDIGGTLKVFAQLAQPTFSNLPQYSVLYVCLMKNAVPGGVTVQTCDEGIQLVMNTSSTHTQVIYIPYPQATVYYIGLNSRCYDNVTSSQVGCLSPTVVNLSVEVSGCVDAMCGRYGVCQEYVSGTHVFTACKCYAGWRGYGCTDGSEARSDAQELMAVLLLTLSNLFFLPAICLAVYRRYFVEATVYLYTMFFSTFYHACDTSDIMYYCMMKYDVLSFADFYGAITSFWVTMLAMAELGPRQRTFTHMLGVLGIAVGVEYDRHGIWVFAVPAGLAALIMIASWVYMCRSGRRLHPPKRYYLTSLLPGTLLAIGGLVMFAFFETEENYKYIHSAWHICVALSIVFLLPPRRTEKAASCTEMRTVAAANQILLSADDVENPDYS